MSRYNHSLHHQISPELLFRTIPCYSTLSVVWRHNDSSCHTCQIPQLVKDCVAHPWISQTVFHKLLLPYRLQQCDTKDHLTASSGRRTALPNCLTLRSPVCMPASSESCATYRSNSTTPPYGLPPVRDVSPPSMLCTVSTLAMAPPVPFCRS